MTLSGIGANVAGNRLTVGASNIAAGDTIQRAVTLTNTGTIDLANVTLTTNATTSSLLNTDTVTGLQMTIDKCSTAWTESAIPYTYTCGGVTSSVLASTAVIGSNLALANLTLTACGSQQPARHPDPPGGCRQHPPGPDLRRQLHVHRQPARRHRAVISGLAALPTAA